VPSERGYRFYVDALMQSYALTAGELTQLNELAKAKTTELDNLLRTAGKVMGSLTNYPAIAVRPVEKRKAILRFSVMPVDEHKFLLVSLLSETKAKTKYFKSTLPLTADILSLLEGNLNLLIAGKDTGSITLPTVYELEGRMGDYQSLVGPIIKYVYEITGSEGDGDLRIDGMNRLLEYPEYTETGKLREMLSILDRKEDLIEVVSGAEDDGVNIIIGSENSVDAMNNSSLVFKKIVFDGKTVGAIGVIGPLRMDYARVLATLDNLGDNITHLLSDSGRLNTPDKGEDYDG
jgi:heat-inducible transcriptional repressor